MSAKATQCKVCGSKDLHHGAYCKPCWRRQEYIYRHGTAEGYQPAQPSMTPKNCERCTKEFCELRQRHPNYRRLCHQCGVDKQRELQRSIRAKQRRPPSNPIIVAPKTHRAKGQSMAPPPPKVEAKPEPVVIPPGKEPQRIPLNISRWEHGGDDLWTPRESQKTY